MHRWSLSWSNAGQLKARHFEIMGGDGMFKYLKGRMGGFWNNAEMISNVRVCRDSLQSFFKNLDRLQLLRSSRHQVNSKTPHPPLRYI